MQKSVKMQLLKKKIFCIKIDSYNFSQNVLGNVILLTLKCVNTSYSQQNPFSDFNFMKDIYVFCYVTFFSL